MGICCKHLASRQEKLRGAESFCESNFPCIFHIAKMCSCILWCIVQGRGNC